MAAKKQAYEVASETHRRLTLRALGINTQLLHPLTSLHPVLCLFLWISQVSHFQAMGIIANFVS
jgi:hypothetical protein